MQANKVAWWQNTLEVAWPARTVHRLKLSLPLNGDSDFPSRPKSILSGLPTLDCIPMEDPKFWLPDPRLVSILLYLYPYLRVNYSSTDFNSCPYNRSALPCYLWANSGLLSRYGLLVVVTAGQCYSPLQLCVDVVTTMMEKMLDLCKVLVTRLIKNCSFGLWCNTPIILWLWTLSYWIIINLS